MNVQQSIEKLNFYANALNLQAYQHQVQGKIFASQGFSKLGTKYAEHATEESGWVEKFLDRILDLGGEPTIDAVQGIKVFNNIEEYLKYDQSISVEGIEVLRKDVLALAEDVTTYDILKDYLKDEEEDMYWTDQQLELIKCIGLQNWLVQQL
ncbi:MAG TPA: ferritin-like domain-containing protein [Prevotella sp.]